MECSGHGESGQCKAEEYERNVEVECDHVREDGDGSDSGDDNLRQILAEEDLQSFDSLDQRQH